MDYCTDYKVDYCTNCGVDMPKTKDKEKLCETCKKELQQIKQK